MNNSIKKAVPIILSIFSSIGVIGTSLLVIKETKKSSEHLESVKKDSGVTKNYIKEVAKAYYPSIILGSVTIASIVSQTILDKKTEASLTATALMLDQGYRKYKGKISQTLGFDTNVDILSKVLNDDKKAVEKAKKTNIKDGEELYFEEHLGFFKTTPEKLALAYADLNQRLHIEDYGNTRYYAMLYNFIEDGNFELLDKTIQNRNLQWGWSDEYLMETYGYSWVHMFTQNNETDDGLKYIQIVFHEEPILDPGNHGEDFVDNAVEHTHGKFRKSGDIWYEE